MSEKMNRKRMLRKTSKVGKESSCSQAGEKSITEEQGSLFLQV